jgi:hypothetical protein
MTNLPVRSPRRKLLRLSDRDRTRRRPSKHCVQRMLGGDPHRAHRRSAANPDANGDCDAPNPSFIFSATRCGSPYRAQARTTRIGPDRTERIPQLPRTYAYYFSFRGPVSTRARNSHYNPGQNNFRKKCSIPLERLKKAL